MARARSAPARLPELAPDDDARAAARRVLDGHLESFHHEEAGARLGDVEAVHQLRVATRRIRAALQLFAPVLPATAAESLRDGFAWIGTAIGAVRDLDVLTLAVARRGRRLDDDLRTALGALEAVIKARRREALAQLVRHLDSARCRRIVARLATLVASRPAMRGAVRLGDVAIDLVRPLIRAAERAGREVDEDAPAIALHRLRVRVKRLRYATETLAELGGAAVKDALGRLERLQDLLGEHQDAVTEIAWLKTCVTETPLPPNALLAMGAVLHGLERRTRRLRRRFPKAWRRVHRRRVRRRVLRALRDCRRADRAEPDREAVSA